MRVQKYFVLPKIAACIVLLFILAPAAEAKNLPVFPRADKAAGKLFVGEKLVYGVRYLGIPIGKGEGEIKEMVEIDGRKAYHVVVRVTSYPAIDLIYRVRDEHHTYIDAEKLISLRYEKNMKQGEYKSALVIRFDHEHHKAEYSYPQSQRKEEVSLTEGTEDQLSAGYWFRTQTLDENAVYHVPVNSDEANWDMLVQTKSVSKMEIDHVGVFQALEVNPKIEFVGLFVKKGKVRGWISMDERRIPLKMKVKIPIFGSVTAELKEYIPGTA